MSDWRIRASAALIVAAGCAAAVALGWDRAPAPHGALLLSMLPGVLLPLMLPRTIASVSRSCAAQRPRLVDTFYAETLSGSGIETPAELRRKNLQLTRELQELRAAYAELARDIADRDAAVERLNYLASHDPLTKLPNRVLLMERLAQALASAQRTGTSVLVMYLDLDDFKIINDTLGHAAGDRVLTEIAGRIAGCMRESDTASRVGGDEFVLVCAASDAVGDAARIRSRLLAAISAPIDIDGRSVAVGASLGMSTFPGGSADPAQLIDRADQAMYAVKVAHRT